MRQTLFLYFLFSVQYLFSQDYVIEYPSNAEYENVKIAFSNNEFDDFIVTERVANISNGEIYWMKESIDTISIQYLYESGNNVSYAIKDSHNDWMDLLYDREILHLLQESVTTPLVRVDKNIKSKSISFPDSCLLAKEIKMHLNNRIRLLKQVGNYSDINRWEKLIDRINGCEINQINLLQKSRNILALDNYFVPKNKDTIKYTISQKEHFGVETEFEAYKRKVPNGNTIIYLVDIHAQSDDQNDFNSIINMFSKDSTELKIYEEIPRSIQSSNQREIEIDTQNQLVRFTSKINSSRLNKDKNMEYRFYYYEIKNASKS